MVKERRKALAAALPDSAIALLFSGQAPYKVGDEKYPFSVDRSFYYFTGLDKENMIWMLVKHKQYIQEYLFIEHYDEELARWVGGRILPEDAAEISGIDAIDWIEEAMDTLLMESTRRLSEVTSIPVFADFSRQETNQELSAAHRFTQQLIQLQPQVQLHNITPYTTALRLVKDEHEIETLKAAIEVTKRGIYHMMDHVHVGMYENELEAYFDFTLKTFGCHHSFPSIIASSKNATILHYEDNNQKIKKNALVLCDLGAAVDYMNADITRTFPASGTFTKRQREIYDIVLRANRYIMSLVKPGRTLKELNDCLVEFYEKELSALHLLRRGKRVQDYYWHGVSHMLGLETHDVTLANYVLQPGNVFTIEPGLYLEEESIGIRIEDNVLVTEDGCINLSADIIKEADEIEAYMAQHTTPFTEEGE